MRRYFHWFTGKTFHDFFPVYVWIIEHPEGLIVIDTGETAQSQDPLYYPAAQRSMWVSNFKFDITPLDEIGPRMQQLGLDPEDVRWVILTHAHMDHTNGLSHFPKAQFMMSRPESAAVGRLGGLHGCVPSRWPAFFQPTLVDYEEKPYGAFSKSKNITRCGDVIIVPTPGHTIGHQSVIVRGGGVDLFLAGDVSFNIPTLLNNTLDGVSYSVQNVTSTRQQVLAHLRTVPTVYLPTHDTDSGARLQAQTVFDASHL